MGCTWVRRKFYRENRWRKKQSQGGGSAKMSLGSEIFVAISAVVADSTGKLVTGSVLETKAATVLPFLNGWRGSLHVTFDEGTCAVCRVRVCHVPRAKGLAIDNFRIRPRSTASCQWSFELRVMELPRQRPMPIRFCAGQ